MIRLIEKIKTLLILITTISFIICIIFFEAFQMPQTDSATYAKSGQYKELMHLGSIMQPKTFKLITYVSFSIGFTSLLILLTPFFIVIIKNRKILFSKDKNITQTIKNVDEDIYFGNSKTKIFHNKDCTKIPHDEIKVIINSRHKAFELGFKPCRNCKP